jgi:hypothetical protein
LHSKKALPFPKKSALFALLNEKLNLAFTNIETIRVPRTRTTTGPSTERRKLNKASKSIFGAKL